MSYLFDKEIFNKFLIDAGLEKYAQQTNEDQVAAFRDGHARAVALELANELSKTLTEDYNLFFSDITSLSSLLNFFQKNQVRSSDGHRIAYHQDFQDQNPVPEAEQKMYELKDNFYVYSFGLYEFLQGLLEKSKNNPSIKIAVEKLEQEIKQNFKNPNSEIPTEREDEVNQKNISKTKSQSAQLPDENPKSKQVGSPINVLPFSRNKLSPRNMWSFVSQLDVFVNDNIENGAFDKETGYDFRRYASNFQTIINDWQRFIGKLKADPKSHSLAGSFQEDLEYPLGNYEFSYLTSIFNNNEAYAREGSGILHQMVLLVRRVLDTIINTPRLADHFGGKLKDQQSWADRYEESLQNNAQRV